MLKIPVTIVLVAGYACEKKLITNAPCYKCYVTLTGNSLKLFAVGDQLPKPTWKHLLDSIYMLAKNFNCGYVLGTFSYNKRTYPKEFWFRELMF